MEQLKRGSTNMQIFPLTIGAMSNSVSATYMLQQLTSWVVTVKDLDFVFDILNTRGCPASLLCEAIHVSLNCQ
jgi:hypothetical protein